MNEKQLTELYQLMGKRIAKYTNGGSSSVPAELAQQIIGSILYCLQPPWSPQNKGSGLWAVEGLPLEEQYQAGLTLRRRQVAQAEHQLKQLQAQRLPLEQWAYQDTLKGLEVFFQHYDVAFAAQVNVGEIDYPLCMPVSEQWTGIDFISAYLYQLTLEEAFCHIWSVEEITAVLNGYHHEAEQLLLNIFELVFASSMGRSLLERDCRHLVLSAAEQAELQQKLSGKNETAVQGELQAALRRLVEGLGLEQPDLLTYLSKATVRLTQQIVTGLVSLDALFPAEKVREQTVAASWYAMGQPMEDRALRALLAQLAVIEDLSTRISLLQQQVHCLQDYQELLATVFWPGEYEAVFSLLSETDYQFLSAQVQCKQAMNDPLLTWELALLGWQPV